MAAKIEHQLKYRLIKYDMWGGEVNNVYSTNTIVTFPSRTSLDSMKDYQVLEHLNLSPEQYEIDNNVCSYPETIYILEKETGRPYCEYRLEQ